MDILRFITAGSVDDGKSTLIGRLLYDSKSILVDQLATMQKQSKSKNSGEIDLAILTDGLRAEREQGITIDVAYKYFSTPKRKFIIADAPGHIQYTRNMITGASNANLIIILVDARKGVIEQTRRHSIIASLLNIPHVVVAVNKMDLVNYSEQRFNEIIEEYKQVESQLELRDIHYIPTAAVDGDNIVDRSHNMTWYKGKSLLDFLEHVTVQSDINLAEFRLPVQYVIRPQTDKLHDYRGYAGRISSGIIKRGDKIEVLPTGLLSTIASVTIGGIEVNEAFAPQSVTIQLSDDIDISRGDLLVKPDSKPIVTRELEAYVCWMDQKPLKKGNRYLIQHNGKKTICVVKDIVYGLNVNTLEKNYDMSFAQLNDVVRINIKTASPLPVDTYLHLKNTGSAILIDEISYSTVGACIIAKSVE